MVRMTTRSPAATPPVTPLFTAAAKSVLFSPMASPAAFGLHISGYSSNEYVGQSTKADAEAEEFISDFFITRAFSFVAARS